MPSGPSPVRSVALTSRTPACFRRRRYTAASYRLRAKRSSLYTYTAENRPFWASATILMNPARRSVVVPVVARSS